MKLPDRDWWGDFLARPLIPGVFFINPHTYRDLLRLEGYSEYKIEKIIKDKNEQNTKERAEKRR